MNKVVRSYSGRLFSWRCRIPERLSRRHSMYAESAARDAAIRSMACLGAPQTLAPHVRMSSSLGACLADSIRLVLASCQPASADSAAGAQTRVKAKLAQPVGKLLAGTLNAGRWRDGPI